MYKMIARLMAGIVLVLAALSPALSRAGTFQVSPLSLTISKFGDVTVTNTSSEVIRFSVDGFAWTQTPAERERRAKSDDLVFFPTVFSLDPGASQRIRVGISTPSDSLERPFRLFITELPPFDRNAANGGHLVILSRIDIPVFQEATAAVAAAPRIAGIEAAGRAVGILLANDGNAHLPPSHVNLVARDTSGSVVWAGSSDVWYVLAKSEQLVKITLPAPCSRIASVTATWAPAGQTISSTAPVRGPCR